MIINAYKPVGKTPLQIIDQVKKIHPELTKKKIAYAGRLDPMAEGVLLLLVEPETRKRDQYQDLDKTYEFEILFGIETDSLDVLGLITKESEREIEKDSLIKISEKLKGSQNLPYPIYSSKTVNGKPLFWWARENKLDEIQIPKKRSIIHELELLLINSVSKKVLCDRVIKKLHMVKGDFRQEKIIDTWVGYFNKTDTRSYQTAKLRACVSSGTYIRSLSKSIAEKMNTRGIAFNIKRTKVGEHDIKNSMVVFLKKTKKLDLF